MKFTCKLILDIKSQPIVPNYVVTICDSDSDGKQMQHVFCAWKHVGEDHGDILRLVNMSLSALLEKK
jgi:hypothetical protein